jgi:hypothetical protein
MDRPRNEHFQWRRSKSQAVRALCSRKHGWKLVRLSPGPGAQGPEASGGGRVVAVAGRPKDTSNALYKLQFVGDGVALGERFEIVALMTGLAHWFG